MDFGMFLIGLVLGWFIGIISIRKWYNAVMKAKKEELEKDNPDLK